MTKGRRSDADRNAYWAAAVALIPSDVFLNRKRRAIIRLLDVEYRVVKTALDMRCALQDGSRKWTYMKTANHCDRMGMSHISRFLHSDRASCEDNDHKELCRVQVSVNMDTGRHQYELHRARILIDTKNALRAIFLESPEFAEMCADVTKKKTALRLVQAQFRARKAAKERGGEVTFSSYLDYFNPKHFLQPRHMSTCTKPFFFFPLTPHDASFRLTLRLRTSLRLSLT